MNKKCTIDGCDNPIRCKGVCNKHYRRQRSLSQLSPCQCGCGELTAYTFKHGHHTRLFSAQEQSRRASFQTGDLARDRGLCTKTYRKRKGKHEHRIVAEATLGRPLERGEIVHHKNGNKRDNRPENLEVMTQSEHIKEHWGKMMSVRKEKRGY